MTPHIAAGVPLTLPTRTSQSNYSFEFFTGSQIHSPLVPIFPVPAFSPKQLLRVQYPGSQLTLALTSNLSFHLPLTTHIILSDIKIRSFPSHHFPTLFPSTSARMMKAKLPARAAASLQHVRPLVPFPVLCADVDGRAVACLFAAVQRR